MDTIDDSAFDFLPTQTEMLEQQCTLLCHELEETQREAAACKRNLAKVVAIGDRITAELAEARKQLAASQDEVKRLTSALSEANLALSRKVVSKLSEFWVPVHSPASSSQDTVAGAETHFTNR